MKFHINVLINIFFIGSISYFLATIVFLFLKPLPSYYFPHKNQMFFFDARLEKNLFLPPKKKIVVKHKTNYIKDFKLTGVYFDGKKGFAIIKDKDKSIFVDLNQEYKGYKLTKINLNSAIFMKNGQKYLLYITNKKIKANEKYKNKTNNEISYPKKIITNVQRKVINFYAKHIGFIWQNIGLIKVSNGYKITYIKPGSVFNRLGLRVGDVLVEVNGRKLLSDSEAWNLFNNINKFDEIRIKILRNNTEKVLRYEIY